MEGEATRDPAFGLPARWIAENDRQRAELGGFTVVDAPSVLITHLGEVVRRHAHELLSREDLKILMDKVRETAPSVVDELIPNVLTMGTLHRVLLLLLEERVPISNLTRILESLANHAPATKEPVELTERCARRPGPGDLRSLPRRAGADARPRARSAPGAGAAAGDPREDAGTGPDTAGKADCASGQRVAQGDGEGAGGGPAGRRQPAPAAAAGVARSLPDLAVVAYQEVPGDLLAGARRTGEAGGCGVE